MDRDLRVDNDNLGRRWVLIQMRCGEVDLRESISDLRLDLNPPTIRLGRLTPNLWTHLLLKVVCLNLQAMNVLTSTICAMSSATSPS